MEANKSGEEPSPKRTRSLSAGSTRPNFFVAIQVSNPEIHRAVRVVQNLVTSKKPLYKSVLIKLITLHITLCTLCLQGNDEIRRAKKALVKLEQDVKETLMKNPVNLKFKGIGSFKNEVVFAKVEPGEPLNQVKNIHVELLKALIDEGLVVTDDFSPHLTMMKMSRDKSLRKKRIFKIPKDLYEEKSDLEFGDQIVRSIQLLRIGDHAEDAYYSCYHTIDLGTKDEGTEDHVECCGVRSVIPSNVIELPPQEEKKEDPMSTESIEIIDSDVGGKELYYRAGASEDAVFKIGEVKLNADVPKRSTTETLKSGKEVSSSVLNATVDENKTPVAIETVELGQGDGGAPGEMQNKTNFMEVGLKNVTDGCGKPEVKSKVDQTITEKS
ncbi:A-kinase anchor protein 7-like isoform X2 [Hetaerina americana]|uniref:A-kinase anchor protein 7-like isoform X2 n=1 Tax=Hetaerina americana TaxID=62018 RepID=UPI003A7F3594